MVLSIKSLLAQEIKAVPHCLAEVNHTHALYPVAKPNREGYLQVSDLHSIFYATYGNPQGMPVVVLHGGPGFGCADALTRFFDLNRWHVIMFDQRGAMRSEPVGCMEENRAQDHVADIERLRIHLGIEQWVVFGGSWGSMLALLYGQEHPKCCLGFILRGIFIGRQQDYLHLFTNMGKIFPEAYEPMVEYIPEEERNDLLKAYHKRIMSPDPAIHLPAARAFIHYDSICATLVPNPEEVNRQLNDERLLLSMGRAFFHYCANGFFVEPNQILDCMDKISHLPAILVQGRYDAICLPDMAYQLYKKWDHSTLWMVSLGGHSANIPAISASLATATDRFLEAE